LYFYLFLFNIRLFTYTHISVVTLASIVNSRSRQLVQDFQVPEISVKNHSHY